MESVPQSGCREKLQGHWGARLDEKGRMKLAVEILDHFKRETDQRIFITTIIPGIASIYPMRVWQQNLDTLAREQDDPESAEDLEFWAHSHGANTAIDSNGRLLVPVKLRQMLGLDGESLVLVPARERIDIYTQAQFEEREQRNASRLPDLRRTMMRKGFS